MKSNIQGRVRDITEQGLGAVVPSPLDPGQSVMLEFTAHDCRIALKAAVAYRRGIHYGFEFVGLTENDSERLRQIRLEQPLLELAERHRVEAP